MFLRAAALSASLFLASIANATAFTDQWWDPAEPGWGVNMVQQSNALHIVVSVYGPDGKPTWYSASAAPGTVLPSGHPRWDGDLYETTSTTFGGPPNPADLKYRKVGSLAFLPATEYSGTLTYDVDAKVVTKAIQRHAFRQIPVLGVFSGNFSTCCGGACTGNFSSPKLLSVCTTPDASGITGHASTALVDYYTQAKCFWSGKYQQFGSVFALSNTSACSFPEFTFNLQSLSASPDGNILYGSAPISTGCKVTFAVTKVSTQAICN